MEKDFSNVQDDIKTLLMGKKINVDVSTFSSFPNNFRIKDDVFTYLIHLGYLTQDEKSGEAWIPNKGMIEEWEKATLTLHL